MRARCLGCKDIVDVPHLCRFGDFPVRCVECDVTYHETNHICNRNRAPQALSGPSDLSLQTGMKFDSEKPPLNLLPPLAILEVGKVLGFGAEKYAPENWRFVSDAEGRYRAAALRHIFQDLSGDRILTDPTAPAGRVDSETGIDHLAHAICCLLFLLELRLERM